MMIECKFNLEEKMNQRSSEYMSSTGGRDSFLARYFKSNLALGCFQRISFFNITLIFTTKDQRKKSK